MANNIVPEAVVARIRKDWRLDVTEPVAVRDRYRRTGWYVANPNTPDLGLMYYMRRDGRVQAAGLGYLMKLSDLEVLS